MKWLLISALVAVVVAGSVHAQVPPSHGIVYATGSKMVRRIISNASGFANHVGSGESILVVQQQNAPSVFEAEAAVEAATGVKPASISVAVVDGTGKIRSVIKADPAIDVLPNVSLIPLYTNGITTDATYDKVTGLFTMPVTVVKAGTVLKNGTVLESDIRSGGVITKPVDIQIDSGGAEPITP